MSDVQLIHLFCPATEGRGIPALSLLHHYSRQSGKKSLFKSLNKCYTADVLVCLSVFESVN